MPTSTATSPPPTPAGSPSAAPGSSAGALWTAGLGAFLLLAAAATFVAVRWDEITDEAKLGGLLALTAACLGAHHRLRGSLPITATALFHLGVLLVPVDVAAVGVGAGWEWPRMLFAQGLVATLVFGWAAHTERSVVLRAATWAAVVTLAGGVGAVTTVPAGVLLAGTALVAAAVVAPMRPELRLDLAASAWAVVAGFAAPLAAASSLGLPFDGVLTDLGLAGAPPHPSAAVTGLLAGAALGVVGARRRSSGLVLAAVAAVLVGVVTTWVSLEPDSDSTLAAIAALCLGAQVARRTTAADPFWARPAAVVAEVGMGITTLLTVGCAVVVLVTPFADETGPQPVAGLAAALVAATWLASSLSWSAAAVSAAAAAALVSGYQEPAAVVLAVVGGAAALAASGAWGGRASSADQLWAAALVGGAPLAASSTWPLAAALGVAGTLVVAEAAVRTSRITPAPPPSPVWGYPARDRRRGVRARGFGVAVGAVAPAVTAALVVMDTGRGPAVSLGLVVLGWLAAVVLDRAEQSPGREPLATVPRVATLLVLLTALGLPPIGAAATAAMLAGLSVGDAARLREPMLLLGAALATPMVLAGLTLDAGWTFADAGIVVTGSGLVWLGLAGSLPGRWAAPALVGALVAATAGLCLASGDGVAFSVGLLIVGAGIAVVGLSVDQLDVVLVGGLLMVGGTWGLLAVADVTHADAYVAPVAVVFLAAGLQSRWRYGTGSWPTLAPPLALLGGTAAYERFAGGSAGHAAVAGAVGVVAVAAGAVWRLAGPLFVGTALVVAVTVHESLDVTANLPGSVWLAAGGAALLGAGITMERRGVGPVETGRRLVDVIGERFD